MQQATLYRVIITSRGNMTTPWQSDGLDLLATDLIKKTFRVAHTLAELVIDLL
jgi:hypothetical protein